MDGVTHANQLRSGAVAEHPQVQFQDVIPRAYSTRIANELVINRGDFFP
ncbi:MAG: Uncharacterised protein [Cyanobium sp. ARS6]|nr:MAG: Uncharacterised protein [Cyanobium sp. ARS6]